MRLIIYDLMWVVSKEYNFIMGRPVLIVGQKEARKRILLQTIEPFLKNGLSVNKAISEAKIHNSELYKYMQEDTEFRDKIERSRNFTAIILSNALFKELLEVVKRQKEVGILVGEDRKFLWKLIKSNKNTRQEWGRARISEFDPEQEIEKMRISS